MNSITEPKEILQILDLDHPGASDKAYRKRREHIAEQARTFRNDPDNIPLITYTDEEHGVWSTVNKVLNKLHPDRACSMYITARTKLDISDSVIPQMRDLSQNIEQFHQFRLGPIEGLVDSRSFLSQLGKKRMLCTQYIRHKSRPTFTPEPDIIHEFIGHAPMFTIKEIVEFSELIGNAAATATNEQLIQLERLYWFTLEYGLIEEQGKRKAFGAGLLAGIEDMNNAFKINAHIKPFHVADVIQTDYNYSFTQPVFFILPSFSFLRDETKKLIDSF